MKEHDLGIEGSFSSNSQPLVLSLNFLPFEPFSVCVCVCMLKDAVVPGMCLLQDGVWKMFHYCVKCCRYEPIPTSWREAPASVGHCANSGSQRGGCWRGTERRQWGPHRVSKVSPVWTTTDMIRPRKESWVNRAENFCKVKTICFPFKEAFTCFLYKHFSYRMRGLGVNSCCGWKSQWLPWPNARNRRPSDTGLHFWKVFIFQPQINFPHTLYLKRLYILMPHHCFIIKITSTKRFWWRLRWQPLQFRWTRGKIKSYCPDVHIPGEKHTSTHVPFYWENRKL